MICLVLEFTVAMTVMSMTVTLWFRMFVMVVTNISVDMVVELNFQMDVTMWFSDECDECDGISSVSWLFSGSLDNSESVSYDCCYMSYKSPVRYFISTDVLMFCERALLSFSEFSLAIKASLAI